MFAAKNLMSRDVIPTIRMGTKISFNGSLLLLFSRLLWRCNTRVAKIYKTISNYKNIDYAYYLLAVCYYEQIVDEKILIQF